MNTRSNGGLPKHPVTFLAFRCSFLYFHMSFSIPTASAFLSDWSATHCIFHTPFSRFSWLTILSFLQWHIVQHFLMPSCLPHCLYLFIVTYQFSIFCFTLTTDMIAFSTSILCFILKFEIYAAFPRYSPTSSKCVFYIPCHLIPIFPHYKGRFLLRWFDRHSF